MEPESIISIVNVTEVPMNDMHGLLPDPGAECRHKHNVDVALWMMMSCKQRRGFLWTAISPSPCNFFGQGLVSGSCLLSPHKLRHPGGVELGIEFEHPAKLGPHEFSHRRIKILSLASSPLQLQVYSVLQKLGDQVGYGIRIQEAVQQVLLQLLLS